MVASVLRGDKWKLRLKGPRTYTMFGRDRLQLGLGILTPDSPHPPAAIVSSSRLGAYVASVLQFAGRVAMTQQSGRPRPTTRPSVLPAAGSGLYRHRLARYVGKALAMRDLAYIRPLSSESLGCGSLIKSCKNGEYDWGHASVTRPLATAGIQQSRSRSQAGQKILLSQGVCL